MAKGTETASDTGGMRAALLEERRGYEVRLAGADGEQAKALKARITGVDAELKRIGGGTTAKPAAERAEKRA